MNAMAEFECPEPLREALADLLTYALVSIRNNSTDAKLCFSHADHMHNVPVLLARFRPDLLAYYWEVERPGFIRDMKAMGQKPPGAFEEFWEVVEREYRRLCEPSTS